MAFWAFIAVERQARDQGSKASNLNSLYFQQKDDVEQRGKNMMANGNEDLGTELSHT